MRNSLAGKLKPGSALGSANGIGDVNDFFGPGGPRRASYSLYLASKYREAWVAPMKSSARTTVKVKVTISRDGTVLSSEVLSNSGNRDFDRAADSTVKRIRKFDQAPPTNEPSVTYVLEFIPDT
jgi:TonB family protein